MLTTVVSAITKDTGSQGRKKIILCRREGFTKMGHLSWAFKHRSVQGREEGRSEGRKAGKGGRKRTRGREVPVLEVLEALPALEVGREGGASPFLLPGEVPASRGGSGPSRFSFSLRFDVLLLTREEAAAAAAAAAAEDGVAESVNSAPLLGCGAGRPMEHVCFWEHSLYI